MDFFKSVFSDDPDPSDLEQTDHTSPSQSPKNQESNQESDQEQEQDQESPLLDPTSNPESSSINPTSAWNFGGLIKTLATKSETVIQTYRRDLEEFGSGLKKETEAIREAASRAVKELPSSIEVGASVAQNSLESVGNVIDEFGNSVWRGTSEIISNSKDSILSTDVESDSSDSQYFRHSNSRPYSRFEIQVHAIQSDLTTYSEQPDDFNDFSKWKSEFVLEEKREEIDDLIADNGVMEDAYVKLVPSVVDHETFWMRYFYRVHKFKQAEDARANLVKRAISGEEEDLSWGDDDDDEDDDNEYQSKSVSMGVNTQKEDTPEAVMDKQSEIQNSVVVDGETTDKNPTPTPAPAPTNMAEAMSDNVSSENIQSGKEVKEEKSSEQKSDPSISEVKTLPSEKDGHGESSKPVVESKPFSAEEEDIEWDEIEDMGSNIDKKVSVGGSPNKVDLRKRLGTAEEEEDLSWEDYEDDDEPVKH